jgi:hypothetical protein
MRTLFVVVAMLAALLVGAPAQANYYGQNERCGPIVADNTVCVVTKWYHYSSWPRRKRLITEAYVTVVGRPSRLENRNAVKGSLQYSSRSGGPIKIVKFHLDNQQGKTLPIGNVFVGKVYLIFPCKFRVQWGHDKKVVGYALLF